MKKTAVLLICVLFYASVAPIVAETPEIREARIAGENDANGFNWKWFSMSYLICNTSPLVFILAIGMIEKYNLDAGRLRTMDPKYCLAAYGIYTLAPTAVAIIDKPTPPADRLLGKSPDWINAYTKAYQKSMKRYRAESSALGCITGTGVLAATFFMIIPMMVGDTPGAIN